MPIIAPSILSADFLELGNEIERVNQSEADWFHLDVMDGKFVPNISYGMSIISQMKQKAEKPFDVHLMIVEPERYFDAFQKAGADWLTIHIEASPHLHRSLQAIKNRGMKAGVALNPHTPVSSLSEVIRDIDLVLIMSVNPGFGGQQFIEHSLEKVRQAKRLITETGSQALIEVDGGVQPGNASSLVQAGADVLVAGNTVFRAPDPKRMIAELKAIRA